MAHKLVLKTVNKIDNFGGLSKVENINLGEYLGVEKAYHNCFTSMNIFECTDGNMYGLVLRYALKDHRISQFKSVRITDFIVISSFAKCNTNGTFIELNKSEYNFSDIYNTIVERDKNLTISNVILEWNGTKFNGKVYGKNDNYYIFLNNEKYVITNDEANKIKTENAIII